MIIHIKLILLTIFLVEFIIFFKILKKLKMLINFLNKLLKLFFFKNISDHWKEKALFKYSKNIFFYSFQVIGFFLILIISYWLFSLYNHDLNKYLFTLPGILESILIVAVYLKLKKILNA